MKHCLLLVFVGAAAAARSPHNTPPSDETASFLQTVTAKLPADAAPALPPLTEACDQQLLFYWRTLGQPVKTGCSDGKGRLLRILQLLSPSQQKVFLDIGANRGFWLASIIDTWLSPSLAVMQSAIQQTGVCDESTHPAIHIHAFEPAPKTFELLQNSTAALPVDRLKVSLTLVNSGVAHHEGHRDLWDDNANGSETSSFSKFNEPDFASSADQVYERHNLGAVPVCTVDEHLRREGLDQVYLMKIDVEGFDVLALGGAVKAIQAGRIQVIIMEYNLANPGHVWYSVDAHILLKEMESYGYAGFFITNDKIIPLNGDWWHRLGLDRHSLCLWCNLVWMKRSSSLPINRIVESYNMCYSA